MENTKVVAPKDGIIKTINENKSTSSSDNNSNYDNNNNNNNNSSDSTSNAYITIMAKGDYRIKATASELTVRSMSEGQSMIVRSRVDDSTWTGKVTKIDLEHPDNGSSNDYYGNSGTTATKYPFYISLDSTDGLMLGQHVYVEADYGQGDVKEGLWLDEYYIMQEDDGAFVWAENAKGYIEKRKVELGEYDENMMRYQILSGLTEDDYIAYPEERVKEGMKVTHNYEDVVIDDTVEDATGGDSLYDDGYTDEGSVDGYTDDGILDDGSINNIDDCANTDGIDGSVEEAAPQDESAPDSDSEVVQ